MSSKILDDMLDVMQWRQFDLHGMELLLMGKALCPSL